MSRPTSTTSPDNTTSQHGQLTSLHGKEVMDIDTDGQRMAAPTDLPDRMDTSLDRADDALTKAQEASRGEVSKAPTPKEPDGIRGGNVGDGVPYLLCQNAHEPQRPHLTDDLLSLYGLQVLVSTVARTDPITGDKINKMRRSYEGQVKTFGLAGRNKAIKHEDGKPGGLVELTIWPDEEWRNQKEAGKELAKGLPSSITDKLERAMKMEPGPVSKNDEWEHILGHEKLKPSTSQPEQKGKKLVQSAAHPMTESTRRTTQANGTATSNDAASVAEAARPKRTGRKRLYDENSFAGYGEGYVDDDGAASVAEAARPKRTGRKRQYDENSFAGYGEGYVDDDGEIIDGGGYSSGEGSRKGAVSKKKRKKEYGAAGPPLGDRAGSYGVGMIGVGTSIGAYGR